MSARRGEGEAREQRVVITVEALEHLLAMVVEQRVRPLEARVAGLEAQVQAFVKTPRPPDAELVAERVARGWSPETAATPVRKDALGRAINLNFRRLSEDEIEQLRRSKASTAELARDFGVSERTVRRFRGAVIAIKRQRIPSKRLPAVTLSPDTARDQLRGALENLGWNSREVAGAVKALEDELGKLSLPELLKMALARLGSARGTRK